MKKGSDPQDQATIMFGLMAIGITIVNQGHTKEVMVFGLCHTVDEDISQDIGETIVVGIIGIQGDGGRIIHF
jgi:hypothetical protein